MFMKWQDLDSLSWNDLSHFTYGDMLLGKLELLEKANQDIMVPDEIVYKLRNLCSEVLEANSDLSVPIPKEKKQYSLGSIVMVIKLLLEINSALSFDGTPLDEILSRLIDICT